MPALVRFGSAGVAVQAAQAQLNLAFPQSTPLVLDGLFGPLTRERTLQFQRDRGLSADAIIGPMTWGALGKVKYSNQADNEGALCGNGDPANQPRAQQLALAIRGGAFQGSVGAAPVHTFAPMSAFAAIKVGGVTLTPLKGSKHEPTARGVYGSSLEYDRIFLSDGKGLEGRAFTLAVPVPPLVIGSLPFGGTIQVLNIGTSPDRDTLIHECGHAWQSQHAKGSAAYIANCVACQGAALAANKLIGEIDSSVKSHARFPVNYPMSAYAYKPGAAFETYAGEQIAQQIQKNEAAIVTLVKGTSAGTVSQPNDKSLAVGNIKIEDRRAAGVKM
jgi:hypothetical protein